jgi:prepilin-type N-terminal cleavage/methylation domain-containing protein
MKLPSAPSPFPRKAGFTLVELLVVMGIIAILAAVTLSVGNTVINEAKKARAQNTATQIQTAVLNYYTEYSVYPTPTGAASGDFGIADNDTALGNGTASSWGKLTECLSGMICPYNGTTSTETTYTNTRSIAFLTLKASDVDNGTTTSVGDKDAPVNPLYNSTNPYIGSHPYFNIAMDGDYDGIIGTGSSGITTLPNFSSTTFSTTGYTGGGSTTAGVAVWAVCSPSGSQIQAGWYVHTY